MRSTPLPVYRCSIETALNINRKNIIALKICRSVRVAEIYVFFFFFGLEKKKSLQNIVCCTVLLLKNYVYYGIF